MEQALIPTDDLHYKWERKGTLVYGKITDQKCSPEVLKSIRKHGIKNPLITAIGRDGKRYVWLGNQRLKAARLIGMPSVFCVDCKTTADVIEVRKTYCEI